MVPALQAPVTLRVDGVEIAPLERSLEESFRGRGPHAWSIPREALARDRITLELDVAHRWLLAGWVDAAPRLVAGVEGDLGYQLTRLSTGYGAAIGALGLGTLGILYLLIFLHDRRRRADGWFSGQLLSATTYPLFVWGPLQRILGARETDILGVALVSAIYTSLRFVELEVGAPRASKAWAWLFGGSIVIGLAATGPFWSPLLLAAIAAPVTAIGSIRQLWVLGVLARKDPSPNVRVAFTSWIVLATSLIPDVIAWSGRGEILGGVRTASLGLAGFGLIQAIGLSRRYLGSLSRADALNVALEERLDALAKKNAENEALADDLRRQIRLRTEELSEAIGRLSQRPRGTTLEIGQQVDGRWTVEGKLGEGSMGAVYAVVREDTGARFALKVLSGDLDLVRLARFAREAKLAASIEHRNVVRVVDTAVAREGFMYLVLEYVGGGSLRDHAARYADVPWALAVLRDVAGGLRAIHERGIVHRDLKPGNVLLDDDGVGPTRARITDFGISGLDASLRTLDEILPKPQGDAAGALEQTITSQWADSDPTLTGTGHILGTAAYMAPEIVRDARAASAASDVYAFGCVAFELLTGGRPFSSEQALLRARTGRPSPPALDAAAPDLPPALVAILTRTLAVDPEARPTAAELEAALDAIVTATSARAS